MSPDVDLGAVGATDYQRVALDLLPVGWAWPREPDTVIARFWGACAGEPLARHHGRVMALLDREAVPSAALELLPDWERVAGLPDACAGPASGLADRRDRVVQRLTGRGGQSPAYFVALATDLGFPGCTVTEYRPFTAVSACTRSIDPDPWRFAWRLNVPADAGVRSFTAGSGCTESLRSWGADALECVVRHLAPAHTHVLFGYPSDPVPAE
jgi:uncharacterized protein YmfQ (DUF2313 family)